MVRVENRCKQEPELENKLPRTTKADKYGGSATIRAADGWFALSILIPLSGRPA